MANVDASARPRKHFCTCTNERVLMRMREYRRTVAWHWIILVRGLPISAWFFYQYDMSSYILIMVDHFRTTTPIYS